MSRIRLLIDGEPGSISLRTYLGILDRSIATLRTLDRAISGKPKGEIDWFIDDLRLGSLTTDLHSEGEGASEVSAAFIGGVATLQHEASVPPYFSEDEMRNIGWIAHQLGRDGARGFRAIDLESGSIGHVTEVTEAHVKEATATVYESVGSVTGTLEMVSIHANARINVYQLRTRKAVRCNIPKASQSDLLPQVTAAFGKVVIASGRIYRNAQGEAIRVTLRSVTTVEEPGETRLPTADDLAGSNPDITGGLSVEEYMRRLRDA